MTRSLVAAAFLAFLATPASAQDMDSLFKSSCEWKYGRTCEYRPKARQRARVRTVYVPYRVHRPDEVYRYGGRLIDDYRRGAPVAEPIDCGKMYVAQSDPKTFRDAEAEAIRRWQGMVAAKCGEVYLDWRKAKKVGNGIVCWRASTGERATDGKEGRHQRCEARGIPRRGDRPGDADKLDDDRGEDDDTPPVAAAPPSSPPREWRR